MKIFLFTAVVMKDFMQKPQGKEERGECHLLALPAIYEVLKDLSSLSCLSSKSLVKNKECNRETKENRAPVRTTKKQACGLIRDRVK